MLATVLERVGRLERCSTDFADYADRRCRTGWIAPFWETQGEPKKAPIHFRRFHKLGEAFAAERAVEVVGQLHGEKEASTFRLEAMRAGSGAG